MTEVKFTYETSVSRCGNFACRFYGRECVYNPEYDETPCIQYAPCETSDGRLIIYSDCKHLNTKYFKKILNASVKNFSYSEDEDGWTMTIGKQHFNSDDCEIISLVVDGKTIAGGAEDA